MAVQYYKLCIVVLPHYQNHSRISRDHSNGSSIDTPFFPLSAFSLPLIVYLCTQLRPQAESAEQTAQRKLTRPYLKYQLILSIIMMMIIVILMLTLNDVDDRNRQHILGIGRYQFLHKSSAEEGRICVPNAYICWTPSISLFLHHHLQ